MADMNGPALPVNPKHRYKGYIRIPPWAWEAVCSDDDYDTCWAKVRTAKRPGHILDRTVSTRDPNVR